jgi:hypothetical protein
MIKWLLKLTKKYHTRRLKSVSGPTGRRMMAHQTTLH